MISNIARVGLMVREVRIIERVNVPENVKVIVNGYKVRVAGPKGELEKDFSHVGTKNVLIYMDGDEVVVEVCHGRKRECALARTIATHIRNMIIGVTKGFRYKMKIVYAHFPMSVKVEGDKVVIENFLGQKTKKYAKIVGDVKVRVEKDDVIIEGIDIEAVGQTAANIHLATHLRGSLKLCPHGRDGGPGVLDGIYLYEKGYMED